MDNNVDEYLKMKKKFANLDASIAEIEHTEDRRLQYAPSNEDVQRMMDICGAEILRSIKKLEPVEQAYLLGLLLSTIEEEHGFVDGEMLDNPLEGPWIVTVKERKV